MEDTHTYDPGFPADHGIYQPVFLTSTESASSGDTKQHLNQVLDNYLDGINMLMLTGSMASRTLCDKFAQQDGIEEVRVLRADAVNKLFGPGFPSEKPQDEYDRRH